MARRSCRVREGRTTYAQQDIGVFGSYGVGDAVLDERGGQRLALMDSIRRYLDDGYPEGSHHVLTA